MHPGHDTVPDLLRRVAADVILPRFGTLKPEEIRSKGHSWDLVTVADTDAERELTQALEALEPGSRVIGEEGVAKDPERLGALAGPAPVWLVDPVDGTQNFAAGKPCFGVIVAYCRDGETRAGWILDPLAGTVVFAARGEGAWLDSGGGRDRLRIPRGIGMASMAGRLENRHVRRLRSLREQGLSPLPRVVDRYGCTAREYMDLAQGTLHFAQYRRLKPWDHAAGILIVQEAGGVAHLQKDRTPYRPAPEILEATVLLATCDAAWTDLDRLFPSA